MFPPIYQSVVFWFVFLVGIVGSVRDITHTLSKVCVMCGCACVVCVCGGTCRSSACKIRRGERKVRGRWVHAVQNNSFSFSRDFPLCTPLSPPPRSVGSRSLLFSFFVSFLFFSPLVSHLGSSSPRQYALASSASHLAQCSPAAPPPSPPSSLRTSARNPPSATATTPAPAF